jgi:hypothetical protein
MPPSNSSKDCDAGDADCAPRRGVKLNMAAVSSRWVVSDDEGGEPLRLLNESGVLEFP